MKNRISGTELLKRTAHMNTRPFLNRAVSIISWLLVTGGCVTVIAAAYTSYAAYFCVPFWDMWEVPNYLAKRPMSLLNWLWWQHNEHRILIPKLLMLLDYRWFSGTEIFLRTAIFITLLAHFSVLLWAVRKIAGFRGATFRTLAGLVSMCLFCTAQWENLGWGFQISFVLVAFLVTVSFVSFVIYIVHRHNPGERVSIYMALSICAAAAATYTNANGIAAWPILLVVAILERVPKRTIGLILLVWLGITASYLYRYQTPAHHSHPSIAIHAPVQIAAYVGTYVGAPWVWGKFAYPVLFGWIGIIAAALLLWKSLSRERRHPIVTLFAALVLFSLGTALMTALGRLNFGPDQALASRYETFSLIFWFSLGVLLIRFAAERNRTLLLTIQLLILGLMLVGGYRLRYPLRAARERALLANTASLALLTGVADPQTVEMLYPVPDLVWSDVPYLRENRLSLFSHYLAEDLGHPLAGTYELREGQCDGAIDSVVEMPGTAPGGLKITGWAWDPVRRRALSQIVFAVNGQIVGYGEVGYLREDVSNQLHSRAAMHSGWIGFVEPIQRTSPVDLYGIVSCRPPQVCRLANVSIPPDAVVGTSGIQKRDQIGRNISRYD